YNWNHEIPLSMTIGGPEGHSPIEFGGVKRWRGPPNDPEKSCVIVECRHHMKDSTTHTPRRGGVNETQKRIQLSLETLSDISNRQNEFRALEDEINPCNYWCPSSTPTT
ncbi:hypothetical protein PROFUN_15332, partial [Planoprotostelium fungivorum]